MRKLGGAVILMQANFKNLKYVVGNEKTIESMISTKPMTPLCD